MSFNVYTAENHGTRNHIFIFVETGDDKKGRRFHVTGTVLNGMKYETEDYDFPDESASYVQDSLKLVGTVEQSDMARFGAVCEAVEVPGAQMKLNGKLKDPSKPLRRCGEWVQDAVEKLIADGIVMV
jgi:hypothetical protein